MRSDTSTIIQYLHASFYPEVFSYVLFPWYIGEEMHFSFIENIFFPEINIILTWKKKMMSLNSICLPKLSQYLCLWRQNHRKKKILNYNVHFHFSANIIKVPCCSSRSGTPVISLNETHLLFTYTVLSLWPLSLTGAKGHTVDDLGK